MSWKHTKFEDSVTMRSLEKVAKEMAAEDVVHLAKGGRITRKPKMTRTIFEEETFGGRASGGDRGTDIRGR
jgi:hypothetical protein